MRSQYQDDTEILLISSMKDAALSAFAKATPILRASNASTSGSSWAWFVCSVTSFQIMSMVSLGLSQCWARVILNGSFISSFMRFFLYFSYSWLLNCIALKIRDNAKFCQFRGAVRKL